MDNRPTERELRPSTRQTAMYENPEAEAEVEVEAQPRAPSSFMRVLGIGPYPKRREPTRNDGQTSALQRENAKFRDTNRQLRQQVDSLQSRLDNMEQNLVKQEAQIVQAQAYVFENVKGDTWASGDDDTIRAEIEKLQSRIKSWAKKNAIDEMSSLERLDPDESAAFLELLANVARLDRTNLSDPQRALAHLTTALMNKKSPMMCLQALLAYHVYTSIIERPFFALDSDDGTLQSVYRELKRGNG